MQSARDTSSTSHKPAIVQRHEAFNPKSSAKPTNKSINPTSRGERIALEPFSSPREHNSAVDEPIFQPISLLRTLSGSGVTATFVVVAEKKKSEDVSAAHSGSSQLEEENKNSKPLRPILRSKSVVDSKGGFGGGKMSALYEEKEADSSRQSLRQETESNSIFDRKAASKNEIQVKRRQSEIYRRSNIDDDRQAGFQATWRKSEPESIGSDSASAAKRTSVADEIIDPKLDRGEIAENRCENLNHLEKQPTADSHDDYHNDCEMDDGQYRDRRGASDDSTWRQQQQQQRTEEQQQIEEAFLRFNFDGRKIRNYLTLSVMSLLLCNPFLGLAAVVFSYKTKACVRSNKNLTAQQYSKIAFTINVAAMGLGVIMYVALFSWLLYFFFYSLKKKN